MALSCIDTLGVILILSDWRNTLSENWKCMIYSFVESAREVAKLTKILVYKILGHREVIGVRFGWEASLSTRRSLSKSLWCVRHVHFHQFHGKARVFGSDLVKRAQRSKNGWFWSAGRRGEGLLPFTSDRKRPVTKVEDLFFLIFCSFFNLLSDLSPRWKRSFQMR